MRRTSRAAVAGVAGCVIAASGVALAAPGSARAAVTVTVPGAVRPAGTVVGPAAATQRMTVQVWLAPSATTAAAAYATAVSTPGNAQFHHYLSPDAYTARFGATTASAAAVTSWLSGAGLAQVHADRGRDYVSATATVAKLQSALGVRIERYRVAGTNGKSTIATSNDRAVSVPSTLAADILGVTGLNDAPPVKPAAETTAALAAAAKSPTCSHYWAQYTKTFSPAYKGLTKGALPVCGYHASQIRAAYGAPGASTGAGQTVALVEDDTPVALFQTLGDYAKSMHLPAPKSSQVREQHNKVSGGSCGSAARATPADTGQFYPDEEEMDAEAVYAMAPGANQLMVIDQGCDEDQSLLDGVLTVLAGNGKHPSATIVSNSWQIPQGEVSPKTVHAISVRAAAEGVGLYFASGDTTGLSVTDSDPFVTAVGGTTLELGVTNNRILETGWSDDSGSLDSGQWTDLGVSAGGGGTSLVYGQPAYQKGVVPASMSQVKVGGKTVTDRAVPDLAADGDPDSGLLTGYIESGSASHPGPYQTEVNAGTSLATPLIAGLVADAQQGQESAFGFINPVLYRLAGTTALHDILPVTAALPQPERDAWEAAGDGISAGVDVFDTQGRGKGTTQVTAKGYDTMTGTGTPSGSAFVAGLRRIAG
jgi:subtilase family serine protease